MTSDPIDHGFTEYVIPGEGIDHLSEAKAHMDRATVNLSKIVGPSIELLVSAATAHALIALAESLEAVAFDDLPLYPVPPEGN